MEKECREYAKRVVEEIEAIYLKKYNFEVHDKKMKDMIKELSDQYFE